MMPLGLKRIPGRLRRLAALAGLALVTSGCAVEGGALVTDMVEAGLNSVTTAIVNALSEQLARD